MAHIQSYWKQTDLKEKGWIQDGAYPIYVQISMKNKQINHIQAGAYPIILEVNWVKSKNEYKLAHILFIFK